MAWLSFIELDKAVVLVWLDWLVFCEYGFSVSALWCPLATPTVLVGFLLPWTWGVSSQLLQQSTATAPYLGWVAPPDLEHGVAPFGPPVPVQWLSLDLRCGVAPLGRLPWPWAWGSSSQQLLRPRSLALSVATPDLGCEVAPLCCASCAARRRHSRNQQTKMDWNGWI